MRKPRKLHTPAHSMFCEKISAPQEMNIKSSFQLIAMSAKIKLIPLSKMMTFSKSAEVFPNCRSDMKFQAILFLCKKLLNKMKVLNNYFEQTSLMGMAVYEK